MTINAPKNQQDIMCGEDTLERVSTITYLGSKISNDGKVDVEILNRSKKATQIFYQRMSADVGRTGKTMDQRVEELALTRRKLVNELKTMTQNRRMWRTWVETPHQPTP
ncbi:hypothetical protein QE152_g4331 [Popillia japonica]|uniref:Uncharacterized protein n=1 Tax=Popillia japonica TaxID=7064 RepID=A0AAW1MZ61_POPJA